MRRERPDPAGDPSGSRPIIDAVMSQQGVSATVVQELGHPATVFGLVQAGVGVSVLPRLFEVVGSSVEFDDCDGITLLGVRRAP